MLLNNKAVLALGACSCLILSGCGGGSRIPLLPDPVYGEVPQGGYPQPYPQAVDPQPAPVDPAPAPPQRARPAPLSVTEMDAAPPPSAGPSGTSDRGPDRYDEVGYATWYGAELAGSRTASGAPFDPAGFTAAHRTLPLGSYVEVTSLTTGQTILVQITDRGPSSTSSLIDLSQGAAKALGITGRGGVRVRRITPTPGDLSAFRSGQPGVPRLETPPSLLAGLRQRLSGSSPAIPARRPIPRVSPEPQAPATQPAPPRAKPLPPAPAVKGGYYVQVAAFGNKDRAAALAKSLGGSIAATGSLWRVRTGPYANANQAAQARDAVAARGYGDARVVRED